MSDLEHPERRATAEEEPDDCSWVMLDHPGNWQSADKSAAEKEQLRFRALTRERGIRLPYSRKIAHACKIIRMAHELEEVRWGLSFSAGKDSTVLSHIITERLGLRVPHIMSNTRMEYPETNRQMRAWRKWLAARGVDLHVAYPDKRPKEVWQMGHPLWSKEIASKVRQFQRTGNEAHLKRVPEWLRPTVRSVAEAGYPITEKCCDELKKKPLTAMQRSLGITGTFTGIRCSESRARKLMWLQRGALYKSARNKNLWMCHPLAYWTGEDILRYMAENQIPFIATPGRGGSGCVTCGFGAHIAQREGKENPIQLLHRINPTLWKTAMDRWGYREPLQAAGIRIHPDQKESNE